MLNNNICNFFFIFYLFPFGTFKTLFLGRFHQKHYDRFAEGHSFDLLGFIQHLYDTTCLKVDFWVKIVWGLGWLSTRRGL